MNNESFCAGMAFFITENDVFHVFYYAVKSDVCEEYSKTYGWGVKCEKFFGEEMVESAEIKNITIDFDKALEIAKKLKDYSVTPVGMKDAVINLIAGDVNKGCAPSNASG